MASGSPEVHPTEIAYDLHCSPRLSAIGNRPAFGFSTTQPFSGRWLIRCVLLRHFGAYLPRAYQDAALTLDGARILGSHHPGTPGRGWDRTPGAEVFA